MQDGGLRMFDNVIKGLQPLLKEGTAPEAIVGVLKGLDISETIQDKDVAAKLLESNVHLKGARDAFLSAGLETYKKGHYQKELEAAIEIERQKLNPKETDEQKELRALKARLDKAEREGTRERLKNSALLLADELKIPPAFKAFIPSILAEDEAGTVTNLKALSAAIQQTMQATTEELLKKHGAKPGSGGSEPEPENLDKQIEEAKKNKNWPLVMELMNKKK